VGVAAALATVTSRTAARRVPAPAGVVPNASVSPVCAPRLPSGDARGCSASELFCTDSGWERDLSSRPEVRSLTLGTCQRV
jgi:hypothetical protein